MRKTALVVLLCASPSFAQNSTTNPLAAAGCGASDVRFEVKTEKNQHPTTQPEAGKALVYVIGAAASDYVGAHVGTPPTRVGIDGTWVGANGYRSYFFFPVEPGDHHLCVNVQSRIKHLTQFSTTAISFTAEAGKTYYFRTKTPDRPNRNEELKLVAVDPAEAQAMIASASFSTFHLKK